MSQPQHSPDLELISTAKAEPEPASLNERWLVVLTVTRDPRSEGEPLGWDWQAMIGGHPMILRTQVVGHEARLNDEGE